METGSKIPIWRPSVFRNRCITSHQLQKLVISKRRHSAAFEIKLLHIDIEHELLQKQSVITESHEQRDRLSKYCEERKAPPFLLHGWRPEHLHFHVSEGRSTDKKAMVDQLSLPQTICALNK